MAVKLGVFVVPDATDPAPTLEHRDCSSSSAEAGVLRGSAVLSARA